jgi:hypothetical protein
MTDDANKDGSSEPTVEIRIRAAQRIFFDQTVTLTRRDYEKLLKAFATNSDSKIGDEASKWLDTSDIDDSDDDLEDVDVELLVPLENKVHSLTIYNEGPGIDPFDTSKPLADQIAALEESEKAEREEDLRSAEDEVPGEEDEEGDDDE